MIKEIEVMNKKQDKMDKRQDKVEKFMNFMMELIKKNPVKT